MKNLHSRKRALLWGGLSIVLLIAALTVVAVRREEAPPTPPPTAEAPKPMRDVILYFATEDGRYLVGEERQIEDCRPEEDCLRRVIETLVGGPEGPLTPVLPVNTALREVSIAEGTAVVDFSATLVRAHPGGSMSELFTVYALANTLAVNFPHIRQVRILVEGQEVETLKGHVDLRGPVAADFAFAKAPEGEVRKTTEEVTQPAENEAR